MSRNGRRAVLSAVMSAVGMVAAQQRAAAVIYSWVGTGSGNFSTPANWSGGLVPASASDSILIYGVPAGSASVVSNNDLASPFDLNLLLITNNASSAHTFQGAPLRFDTNGTQQETIRISVPNGTLTYGGVTIANDMILTKDLLVSGTRFPTLLTGQISGAGHLSATSAGTFNVTHANTYTGGTNIAFGSHVWVTGSPTSAPAPCRSATSRRRSTGSASGSSTRPPTSRPATPAFTSARTASCSSSSSTRTRSRGSTRRRTACW